MKKVIGQFIFAVISAALSLSAFGASAQAIQKYTVSIVSPANNDTFQSDTQNIPIKIKTIPAIKAKDELHILVDGKLDANSSFGASTTASDLSSEQVNINISKLERGEHSLQVLIYHPNPDNSKTKAGESAKVTIFQQRASARLRAQ